MDPAPSRLLGLALAALALAGCGDAAGLVGGGPIKGDVLTIYSLVPAPESGASGVFLDGEKLALADAHGRAGGFTVNFAALDAGGSRTRAAEASRRAIDDPQTIAVVADARPAIVPLLNEAGLLQVAPHGDLGLAHDPRLNPSGRPTLGPVDAGARVPADLAARFAATFHRPAGRAAVTGYRAMRGVLDAIARAGHRGNDRGAVIDAYL